MSSMEPAGPVDVTFPGDGEMARRMRAYPWADSPLGDPRDWPASLRTAVPDLPDLTVPHDRVVGPGPAVPLQRRLPAAARQQASGAGQAGRGRCGARSGTRSARCCDSVMSSGQATWSEDLLLPMNRHGYWEETYWTYSYSPLHDDDGMVRGRVHRGQRHHRAGRRRGAGSPRCRTWAPRRAAPAAWPKRAELVGDGPGTGRGGRPVRRHLPAQAGHRRAVLVAGGPQQAAPVPLAGGPAAGRSGRCCAAGSRSTVTDVAARFGGPAAPAGGRRRRPRPWCCR